MQAKPNRPWHHTEVTRAKRAYDHQIELMMAGVPAGFWFAIRFDTGLPNEGDSVTWATKAAAVQWIHEHGGDPNQWLFVQLSHDMMPRTWQSIAAVLRCMEGVEAYHRANSDPKLHVHFPSNPTVAGDGYAQR